MLLRFNGENKAYDTVKFAYESFICYIPNDKNSNIHQLVNRLINTVHPYNGMLLNSEKESHG